MAKIIQLYMKFDNFRVTFSKIYFRIERNCFEDSDFPSNTDFLFGFEL